MLLAAGICIYIIFFLKHLFFIFNRGRVPQGIHIYLGDQSVDAHI